MDSISLCSSIDKAVGTVNMQKSLFNIQALTISKVQSISLLRFCFLGGGGENPIIPHGLRRTEKVEMEEPVFCSCISVRLIITCFPHKLGSSFPLPTW